ncbi:MAG: T9SS type A sorting domain-containing protein [Saprospiraceae bacterium]|nr:T9SS type A sorting domain-containing protein [Saprospiraceae bacterium]MDW8484996.1 T9SS type A sorting domain-containing protein [Saprospiraceae bacterium]
MRFTIACFLLFALAISTAVAQTTFSVSATEVWKIAPHTEPDVQGHFTITNLTNQVQTIRWTRTIVRITPGCLSQVCDLNLCYTPPVSTQTFDMQPNQAGLIIMHFLNYDSIVGAEAVIRLRMSNENVPADSVTVTFLFTSPTSKANQPLPPATVKVYPNPTTDGFWLSNAEVVRSMRVLSLDGREVARFLASPGAYYSLAEQPQGSYIIVLEDALQRPFQALEILRQ